MNGGRLIFITLLLAVFLQTNQPASALLQQVASQLNKLIHPDSNGTNSSDIMDQLKSIQQMLETSCKLILKLPSLSGSDNSMFSGLGNGNNSGTSGNGSPLSNFSLMKSFMNSN